MRNFLDLKIWQKSHSFTLKIYSSTKNYPKEEMFGLSSQMRRSASSVPTNIAEGCGRNTDSDFKGFLIIASGSSAELEYQLILSKDLNYLSKIAFNDPKSELIEIRKMIHSFIKKLPTT